MASHELIRTWNIFGHCESVGVRCAVPADYPVPRFILSGDWGYMMPHMCDDAPLLGFDGHVAYEMAKLNGFYLFTTFAVGAPADL